VKNSEHQQYKKKTNVNQEKNKNILLYCKGGKMAGRLENFTFEGKNLVRDVFLPEGD
jgi:hypothetical protein